MKKRHLIPSLLLLSATSLTSCSGSIKGLIEEGQPYVNGQARLINSEVQEKAENSFEVVTMKSKTKVSLKETVDRQSISVSATVNGTAVVDINKRSIEYTLSTSASALGMGGSSKVKIKAQEQNSEWVITSSNNAELSISSEDLGVIFDQASYEVYSWNYTLDEERLNQLVGQVESLGIEGDEIKQLYSDLNDSLVYTGDFATGTFEIGLSRAVSFTLSELKCTYNKMRYCYKDGLINSLVLGMKVEYQSEDVKLVIGLTSTNSYSYSKAGSNKTNNPFGGM